MHRGDARVEDLLEARSTLGDCEGGAVDAPLVEAGVDVREVGAEAIGDIVVKRVARLDEIVDLVGIDVERVVIAVAEAPDGGEVAVHARGLDGAVGRRNELFAPVAVVEVELKGVWGWRPAGDVAKLDVGVVGGHGRHEGLAVHLWRELRMWRKGVGDTWEREGVWESGSESVCECVG